MEKQQVLIRTKLVKLFLFSTLFLSLYGCQKESTLFNEESTTIGESNMFRFNNQNGNVVFPNVTYNSTYDVLVFNTVDDVGLLYDYLINQNPYDRDNTIIIKNKLDEIVIKGYKYGSQANGGEIQLEDLERLLDESHPLSNESIERILELNNQIQLPDIFLQNILTQNTPFTVENRMLIEDSNNISQNSKQIILDADDNDFDSMDPIYEDFLNLFPQYNSLYEKMIVQNIQNLKNGMSPASAQFDNALVNTDFERLIRNEKHEIFITEEGLFKIYTECKEIHLKMTGIDAAYNELAITVDGNGNVDVPIIPETNEGIDISVINQSIPAEYSQLDPVNDDPFADGTDDIEYDTALQTINMDDACPRSNFLVNMYTTENFLDVQFLNTTEMYDNTDTSIRYYWSFGDGTGSFLENPIHSYDTEGVYTVILTTFSLDCGCWHRHKVKIHVQPYSTRGGNPDCQIYPEISIDDVYAGTGAPGYRINVNVVPSTVPEDEGNTIESTVYELYKYDEDGETATLIETKSSFGNFDFFDIEEKGKYFILVTASWVIDCISVYSTDDFYINEKNTDCCDIKEKEKETSDEADNPIISVGGHLYYFDYKDVLRGRFVRRLGGRSKLYKLKSGRYRGVKSQQSIEINGSNFHPLDGWSECKATSVPVDYDKENITKNLFYGSYDPFGSPFGISSPVTFHHVVFYDGYLIVNKQIIFNCIE